ncbi:MAG: hypothetical protein IT165_06200 [Bryobacterales bacterium]|nr:hypothetical protein [Bryobacterales bacterium]
MEPVTITLGFEARINLVSVLDAQQGNLGQLRLLTRIAHKIELSEDQKTAIGYVVVPHPSGAQLPAWNRNADLPAKAVNLSWEEAQKLAEVLENCPYFKRADLSWIEPILTGFNRVK